jgi:hypothetical protein
MKKRYLSVILVLLPVLWSGCTSEKEQEKKTMSKADTLVRELSAQQYEQVIYTVVPPGDIIKNFHKYGIQYKSDIIHDVRKVDSYLTFKSRALNLGIYSVDLAYTAYFGKMHHSNKILDAVLQLLTDLNIREVFDESILEKAMQHSHEPDSVKQLAKNTSKQIYSYLVSHNRDNILALFSVGAFVEILYQGFGETAYEKEGLLVKFLSDQRFTAEILYDFVAQYRDDPQVAFILPDIKKINNIYNELSKNESPPVIADASKNVISIKQGQKAYFTEEQYNRLKEVISDLREKYVSLD